MQNTQMEYPVAKIPEVDKLSKWSQMCLPHNSSIYFSRMKKKKKESNLLPCSIIRSHIQRAEKDRLGLF